MNNTILVVDDEVEITNSLKEHLEDSGYEVFIAQCYDEAIENLTVNKPSLILSDIKMPGKTGLVLFQDYKEKIDAKDHVPFVLMTGHADIISVENAFKFGVNELIAKPFDLEAVALVIDYLLNSDRSYGLEHENFFSVAIEEFILSKTSDYSIYLKIHGKYVRVTKSGQEFTEQRLNNFAKKGATHIYLNNADFAKYTDLQFVISTSQVKRPLAEAKKLRIMNQLISSISQNAVANQIDKQYFNQSLSAFEAYTQAALNHSQLNSILNAISSENTDLAEQSTLKSIIASSIATLWRWNSPKIQSRIILAALLSDVGLKNHKHLLQKKRFEYTAEELQQYEQHPAASYEMLKQIEGIPPEILYVAMQHHENAAGLGFPLKLTRSKTHSYSKLIHGIGVFIETIMDLDDRSNIKKALDQIHSIQGKTVSEQVLKSLYLLFNIEPPKNLNALLLPTDTTRVI
jgi:two-component system response regulator CpxR